MTKRECAIIMAYTGVCMCAGDDLDYFYKYVAELIGRPVYTRELPELSDEIKERSKKDFIEICKNATDFCPNCGAKMERGTDAKR